MDLHVVLRVLRKRWRIFLALVLAGLSLGALATIVSQPVYVSTAKIFVSTRDTGIGGNYQGNQFSQQRVQSYTQIVDTPPVLQPVIEQLGLLESVGSLGKRVSASAAYSTVIVDVSVEDPSPERARDIADAVAASFSRVISGLETPTGQNVSTLKVTVVQQAGVPTAPSRPRPKFNLALGLLAGLFAGATAIVIREALDTTFKSRDDLTAKVHAVPLGVVPFDANASRQPLVGRARTPSGSLRSEAYKQIRTNLQFVNVDRRPKTLVVTSSVANEGKTTTTVNLAQTLAEGGMRVVLVEADLRRPRMGEYLGLESAVGLTSVLIGQVSLEDALQTWGPSDRVQVLASGPPAPNPSELLASHAMTALLTDLANRADLVLVDAPPLLPVADGAILSAISDGALLVVRHGRTRHEQVRRAVEALEAVEATLFGAILNMSPIRGHDTGYYAYGGYAAAPTRSSSRSDEESHIQAPEQLVPAGLTVDLGPASRPLREAVLNPAAPPNEPSVAASAELGEGGGRQPPTAERGHDELEDSGPE